MVAGRLADGFRLHFGKDRVFVKVVTLRGGEDWAEKMRHAVDFAQVITVLIGHGWSAAQDAQGRRRLNNLNDSVRIEVEQALVQDHVQVIPILLEGAPLPRSQDLPNSMARLVELKTFTLTHAGWEQDFKRLKETLEEIAWTAP